MKATLDDLAARIEILATDPERVRSRWASIVGPVLRLVRWQPRFTARALPPLLDALQGRKTQGDPLAPLREAAAELAANVEAAERACVVRGRVPISRLAWLRRLYEVVARAERASLPGATAADRAIAAAIDRAMILPPLAIAAPSEEDPEPAAPMDAESALAITDGLVELELAAIDHLLDAAREETMFLGRRRRLLEGARQLLLEAGAALRLDRASAEARERHIAEQIVRIDRLEAAGLSPDVGLLHQAQGALARRDPDRLHAALAAIDSTAAARGDAATLLRSSQALSRLRGERDGTSKRARLRSLERSAAEVLGAEVLDRIRSGYAAARSDFEATLSSAREHDPGAVRDYLRPGGEIATLSAALAVDGSFDVGGVLSPVRVEEIETRLRAVTYPTQDLVLQTARDVTDVPAAILEDPRRILLDLAEGRLLTRRYIEAETIVKRRTHYLAEARVYLLDGSDSMLEDKSDPKASDPDGAVHAKSTGGRARMRDAILLAELSTLHRRYVTHGARAKVVLFYRYFSTRLSPVARVDSAASALDAIVSVIRAERRGGTDIQGALLSSFDLVREARKDDPDLGRAQIVLVTDGEAPVDERMILAAREQAGDLPIGVSVIALGEENASLRAIVAKQRARGERAFYHHMSDAALEGIARGAIDQGPAVHLDAIFASDVRASPEVLGADLTAEIGALLDELATADRDRLRAEIAGEPPAELDDAARAAREEMGLPAATASPSSPVNEGALARRELLDRDRRALSARFARWFPEPERAPAETPAPPRDTREAQDLDAVIIALGTVAEVSAGTSGTPEARRADAIEILERLLPDARLSPARYRAVLHAHPARTGAALAALHAAVGRAPEGR